MQHIVRCRFTNQAPPLARRKGGKMKSYLYDAAGRPSLLDVDLLIRRQGRRLISKSTSNNVLHFIEPFAGAFLCPRAELARIASRSRIRLICCRPKPAEYTLLNLKEI